MASTHGFRIYVVQAYKNRVKDQDPEDFAPGSAARSGVIDLLDGLHQTASHRIIPKPVPAGEPERPTRTVTIGDPALVRDDLIHVVVSMGESGSHRRATRPKKKSKDLEKWSPEADHNVAFLFPKGSGNEFIVIAQTIRRRDPVPEILRLLTSLGLTQMREKRTVEDAERQRARDEGRKVPKRVKHSRLLFRYRQAVDNSYIDEIMGSAKSATAVFQSKIPSDRGADRPIVRRTLQIKLRDENEREIGRRVGKRWFHLTREGKSASAAEGVAELAAQLSDENLFEEEEKGRYNSASVSVKSESGASTTIAVDTLRDVFTYPVSDGVPSVRFYYEKVAPRVKTVAAEERIEVSVISPVEVEECLGVSTSDRS